MAFPPFTLVGVASAVEVASGNLTLVTTGAVPSTGDLVIACIAYRSTPAFAAPDASWSIIEQQSSGNTSTTASTAIASGVMMVCESWPASPPSLVFTRTGGDVARGLLLVYRGQKASGALDTHSSATLAANSTTPATASITTATEQELLVAMVAGADNHNVSAFRAVTEPTTSSGARNEDTVGINGENAWFQRHDSTTTTGADTSIAVGDAIKPTAGATGEVQATHVVSSRHVMIVASFKSEYSAGTAEQASKFSRYDITAPADDAVSLSKLSRYDVFMAVGTVSVTKLSRYDILLAPAGPTGPKRRVQNINYH